MMIYNDNIMMMYVLKNDDEVEVPVMIGRVHHRVQYFAGNRSEVAQASGFGSRNEQHEDDDDDEDGGDRGGDDGDGEDEGSCRSELQNSYSCAEKVQTNGRFNVISTDLFNSRFAAICAKLERNICASFGVNSIQSESPSLSCVANTTMSKILAL